MDTQFTFPPPQKPVPRPAGWSASTARSGPRESNALRASVLDAALELGLVSNAGWMFDNVLQEENEDEDQAPSPGLTYGSSVTSEESIPSILTPSSSSEAHTNGNNAAFLPSSSHQYHLPPSAKTNHGYGGAMPPVPGALRKDPVVRIVEPDFHDRLPPAGEPMGVPFPESSGGGGGGAGPVRPTTPAGGRKLTKKKKVGDGYESDGGYTSEAGKKKDKRKEKEKEKDRGKESDLGLAAATMDMEALGLVETSKEAKKRAKEEKKEAEAERKRTKSLLSAAKAARKASAKDAGSRDAGYETDGGSSSKVKGKSSSKKASPADASGYETDGTPAKKPKSRFFKLGGRTSSKTDLRAEAQAVPPLPFPSYREQDKEAVPLPIAERFATTLSPSFFSAPTSPLPAEGRVTPLLNQPAASPPLNPRAFPGFAASTSGVGTPISPGRNYVAVPQPSSAPDNRSSQFSATSSASTSSGSRSRAPTDGTTSKHHGTGSATSYSTITSSSTVTSSAAHQYPPPPALSPIPSSSSGQLPPSGAGSRPGVRPGLRPPAVSFSASRSPSPSPSRAPPVSPLSIMKAPGLRLKASLDTLIGARNATPSPISPPLLSPYVMVPTPSSSNVPSPTMGVGMPPSPGSGMLLSPSVDGVDAGPGSGSGFRVGVGFALRARSPSAQSPRAVISPPNTAVSVSNAAAPATSITGVAANNKSTKSNLNINTSINAFSHPVAVESPNHLNIVPSSQYLVPSPRNSGQPSPNVLAYYDLPPPSPAPQGPLPTPPLAGGSNSHPQSTYIHLPSPAALRQRVIDRTPRALPPELSAALHGQALVQRGRESPFPTRPILPAASAPQPAAAGAGAGLEAWLATRRYRELYAPLPVATATGGLGAMDMERYQEEKEQAMERRRARLAGERESSWIIDAEDSEEGERTQEDAYGAGYYGDGDEGDSQELRGVMDRFAPDDTNSSEGHTAARALGRRRSSDAFQGRAGAAGPFEFEDDGRTVGDRLSRWSGSIYSRESILDADESGETRDRLVKEVEAMLDAERRDGGAGVEGARRYVPPVPRLPAAYANMAAQVNTALPGRSWNRF